MPTDLSSTGSGPRAGASRVSYEGAQQVGHSLRSEASQDRFEGEHRGYAQKYVAQSVPLGWEKLFSFCLKRASLECTIGAADRG